MYVTTLFIWNIKGHDGNWYFTSTTTIEGLKGVLERTGLKDFTPDRQLVFKSGAARARRFAQNLMHSTGKTLKALDTANSGVCPITTFDASTIDQFIEYLNIANSLPEGDVVRQWYQRSGYEIVKTGTHPDNIEQTMAQDLENWVRYMTNKYQGRPSGSLVIDNDILYQIVKTENGDMIFRRNLISLDTLGKMNLTSTRSRLKDNNARHMQPLSHSQSEKTTRSSWVTSDSRSPKLRKPTKEEALLAKEMRSKWPDSSFDDYGRLYALSNGTHFNLPPMFEDGSDDDIPF